MISRCNSWWLSSFLCLYPAGLSCSTSAAAETLSPIEKVVVSKGVVFACKLQKSNVLDPPNNLAVSLHAWSVKDSKSASSRAALIYTSEPRPRWNIARGYVWLGGAMHGTFPKTIKPNSYWINPFKLDLRKEELITADDPADSSSCFVGVKPADYLASLAQYDCKFPTELYYDYVLSTSPNTLEIFILTNIGGKIQVNPPLEPGTKPYLSINDPAEKWQAPKWSLTMFASTATRDKETKQWQQGIWEPMETITPLLFQEEFQVAARGDTYYFLTKSGKVYQSKMPDKGKERTMKALWTDAEQPVITFVVDSDNDHTYVFTKNKKKDAKDVYFELADKPKPVPYNLADVKLPKEMSEPMKRAFPYAQILLNDGKIKAK